MNKTLKVIIIVLGILVVLAFLVGAFTFHRHGFLAYSRHIPYMGMPHMFGGLMLMGLFMRLIGFLVPVALLAWLFWYMVNKLADKKAASMSKEVTAETSKPKVCPNCDKHIEDVWVACPYCGNKI
jgi:hypothetical protein